MLGAYWFLIQLLFASLLGFVCLKYIQNEYVVLVGLLFLSFVLSILDVHITHIPISDLTFKATFFYCAGYFIAKRKVEIKTSSLVGSGCMFFVVLVSSFITQSGMITISSFKWILYAIVATIATVSMLRIGCYIESNKNTLSRVLVWLGNHTFDVLTWHFLSFKIVSWIIVSIYGLSKFRISDFPSMTEYSSKGWWVVYSVLGLLGPIFIAMAKDKFFIHYYSWRNRVC